MTASDRINQLLEYYNLNAKQFSERIGDKRPQRIYDVQKGKAQSISTALSNQIISVFPAVSKAWLLTGEGEMLKKDTPVDDVDKEAKEANTGVRRVNMVPLLPASAFAGSIEGFAPDSVALEQCDRIVTPVPGAEMAIPITGDSMEPDYPDGSVAYIRRINDSSFIPWGHTVILDTENGAFIKRIYPDEEDADYVWAKSINPDYPPMHIPRESIYRIFHVLATARIYTTM